MNPQEEKDLISYLEGEIKYDEEKGLITIKDEPVIDIYGFGPKIYDHELGHFVTQLLINERERRKEQDGLSDQKIDQLLENINYYSEKYNGYEYGVPIFGEHVNNLREIVRKSLITPKKEEGI